MGCDSDLKDKDSTLKCLREKHPSELLKVQMSAIEFPNIFPFIPTLDGTFVVRPPLESLLTGQFQNVPLLIGSNENEGNW